MILRHVNDLSYLPQRIISLVPSQTELLHNLGLEQETVGITSFCVHPPEWFNVKTRVGGTKNLKKEIIDRLQPDLIIANKEENTKEQVEELAKEYNVWVTEIHNLEDAMKMIEDIGSITRKTNEAKQLVTSIKNEFSELKNLPTAHCQLPAVYLIWQNPYMTIGGDTFINDMLDKCGLKNVFAGKLRYPQITIEDLQLANCQLLLLSSEPFPFKQKDIDELQKHLPATKIILVDGEMFSWYGSRLLSAPIYFKNLNYNIL